MENLTTVTARRCERRTKAVRNEGEHDKRNVHRNIHPCMQCVGNKRMARSQLWTAAISFVQPLRTRF